MHASHPRRIPFILSILASLSVVRVAALPYEGNELVAWGVSGLQLFPSRPLVGIGAGRLSSLAVQDDGVVIAWGGRTRAPDISIRGAAGVFDASGFGVVALMPDGTLRSRVRSLDSCRGVVDLSERRGVMLVLDSGHVARVVFSDGVRGDTVQGVKGVARTNDGNWYLRDDGTVLEGGAGALTPHPELGRFRKIAAGGWHVSGIREDGTVAVWGDTTYRQTDLPSGLTDVVDVRAGRCHTVALRGDGTVESWGIPCARAEACPTGGLGRTSAPCVPPLPTDHPLATPEDLKGVRAIASGDLHALALLGDGSVVGWGDSSAGAAVVPQGRTNVARVDVQGDLIGVLQRDGALSIGALPGGAMPWREVEPQGGRLRVISVAEDHVLGIDSSGGLRGWNADGRIRALPTTASGSDGSVVSIADLPVVRIAAGPVDAIQLEDGRLFAWSVGDVPRQIELPSAPGAIREIMVAGDGVYALHDGGALVMSSATVGDLLDGGRTDVRELVRCGGSGVLYLDGAGAIHGPLGQNWHGIPDDAAPLGSLPALSQAACGTFGVLGLDTRGAPVAWGDDRGPFAFPVDLPPLRAVATGTYFAIGVRRSPADEPLPVASRPASGLAPGGYPARLLDLRGRLLWSGVAAWNGSSWRVPKALSSLSILRAVVPGGVRMERIAPRP